MALELLATFALLLSYVFRRDHPINYDVYYSALAGAAVFLVAWAIEVVFLSAPHVDEQKPNSQIFNHVTSSCIFAFSAALGVYVTGLCAIPNIDEPGLSLTAIFVPSKSTRFHGLSQADVKLLSATVFFVMATVLSYVAYGDVTCHTAELFYTTQRTEKYLMYAHILLSVSYFGALVWWAMYHRPRLINRNEERPSLLYATPLLAPCSTRF
jgi:hypothetical protein